MRLNTFFLEGILDCISLKGVYDTKNVTNPSSKAYVYITEISPHAFARNVFIMRGYLKERTTS